MNRALMIMVGLFVVSMVWLAYEVISERLDGDPMTFERIEVTDLDNSVLTLRAWADTRVTADMCLIDTQFYVRRNGERFAKVEGSKMGHDGVITYRVSIASLPDGEYEASIREAFNCGGSLRVVDSPYVGFEVGE